MRLLDSKFFSLPFWLQAAVAVAAMALVGLWAWRKRQLSVSGLAAAMVMGAAATLSGGFTALSLYLFFLISAAVIGKLSRRVRGLERIHKKGGRRDFVQVLANGGAALVAVVAWRLTGSAPLALVFCACLGEACSDTWASEIGVLSKKPPVSVLTFTPVPTGISGGVSLLGTGAGLLSSLLYGLFALSMSPSHGLAGFSVVAVSAFAGVFADSLLGASLQAHYRLPDGSLTEKGEGPDGDKLPLARGWRGFDNDMVNFVSNLFSGLLCLVAASAL